MYRLLSAIGAIQTVFQDEQRQRFAKRAFWGALVAFALLYPVLNSATRSIRIGIDLQEVRCLPWRIYLLKLGRPHHFERGHFVAFKPLGGLMGPQFEGLLVGKMVAGVPGDRLEVKNDVAHINGKRIGELSLLPKLGVKPGGFDRTAIVPPGKIFVIGTEPRSYDGRYWGFLDQSEVIGSVSPIF